MESDLASRRKSEFGLDCNPLQPRMSIQIEHIVVNICSRQLYIVYFFKKILSNGTSATLIKDSTKRPNHAKEDQISNNLSVGLLLFLLQFIKNDNKKTSKAIYQNYLLRDYRVL